MFITLLLIFVVVFFVVFFRFCFCFFVFCLNETAGSQESSSNEFRMFVLFSLNLAVAFSEF